MAVIRKSIAGLHRLEHRFDRRAERFAFHHPYAAFFAMFVGMPLLILLAVTATTFVLSFPMAYMFGWL
ncbi:MAG: hypothetical protein ACLVEV_00785 [Lachnospiraceae bacterium]|uniref:hypothetical protein n=1 Tax=Parablautia sp. Marseille-Q6255 TaxID=3039593 RepID=UPI0024BC23CE|nr:hypothetical protein [Parablautia sp. Marseille-Q6255]